MARAAVLIVRVWKDEGGRIVARITSRADAEEDATQVAVVGSVEEVISATEAWLNDFWTH